MFAATIALREFLQLTRQQQLYTNAWFPILFALHCNVETWELLDILKTIGTRLSFYGHRAARHIVPEVHIIYVFEVIIVHVGKGSIYYTPQFMELKEKKNLRGRHFWSTKVIPVLTLPTHSSGNPVEENSYSYKTSSLTRTHSLAQKYSIHVS
jgi:hypothetical protein